MIRTSFKNNKRVLLLYSIILVIGIISGVIYSNKILTIDSSLIKQITVNSLLSFNIFRIVFIIITPFLTYIFIGPFFSLFNMFLEGLSMGVIILSLYLKAKLKGLIFSIVIIIIGKLIYCILILILGIISIRYILDRKKDNLNNYKYLKKTFIIILLTIINEFIIRKIAIKICLYFSFLIN